MFQHFTIFRVYFIILKSNWVFNDVFCNLRKNCAYDVEKIKINILIKTAKGHANRM